MTGKYPARLNMTIWHEAARNPPMNRKLIPPVVLGDLPHDEVTIAEVLHAAGYLTVHIGKWHLGEAAYYPETQGFDINIGGTFWGAPQSFFFPYRGTQFFDKELRYVPGLPWGQPGEYLTDRLTDEALNVIEKASSRPFFLNMCYHTVHTPIQGKPELVERYKGKLRPGARHKNPDYAAMVASLDESVGRILAKIDERGLADNTVVIFTSDNGGFINNFQGVPVTDNHPLRSGKGSLYEGGVRVPLIVRWPGVTQPNSVSREPVASIDFYPTILEITGLTGNAAHNANVDGLSLVPVLRDPGATLSRDALYFHYPHYYQTTSPVSAVRARDWKLLEYFEDNHVELYRLADDLSESKDLSADAPARARQLRDALHSWRASVNASMPKPNPNVRSIVATLYGTSPPAPLAPPSRRCWLPGRSPPARAQPRRNGPTLSSSWPTTWVTPTSAATGVRSRRRTSTGSPRTDYDSPSSTTPAGAALPGLRCSPACIPTRRASGT